MCRVTFLLFVLMAGTTVLGPNIGKVFGMRRAQLGQPGRIVAQSRNMNIDRGALGSLSSSPVLRRSGSQSSLSYNRLPGSKKETPMHRRLLAMAGKAALNVAAGSAAIAGGTVLAQKLAGEQNQTVVLNLNLVGNVEDTTTTEASNDSFVQNAESTTTSIPTLKTSSIPGAATTETSGAFFLDNKLAITVGLTVGIGAVFVTAVAFLLVCFLKKLKKESRARVSDIEMQQPSYY